MDLFEGDPVPLDEQIREIERELEVRRSVYPNWVKAGKLRYEIAKRRIQVLESVLAKLRMGPG